jgi:biopolymer transport protein TolQ
MVMKVKNILAVSNPFLDAFVLSDSLGKIIFIGLIFLSVITWVILIQKIIKTTQARKNSIAFSQLFNQQRLNPLNLETEKRKTTEILNPFLEIYQVLKKQTLEMLNKNRLFGQVVSKESGSSFLSPSDIDCVQSYLYSTIATQVKGLEKNLFILSTIVTLGPFLGLLGTVWGILTTFSNLQVQGSAHTNQMVLGGLSLALATTVMGLVDAIPALIGYNYLKNAIRDFETEMEGFSTEILASIEMQYRKVE